MADHSIFLNKSMEPTVRELQEKLGDTYKLWVEIQEMVLKKYPDGVSEWNFPGKKYGWSFRIKDKKRAIIYLLPRDAFFKVAFVFGDKAVNEIMDSTIAEEIKAELMQAKKYAEGRGIRIEVRDMYILEDIDLLIDIKLKH